MEEKDNGFFRIERSTETGKRADDDSISVPISKNGVCKYCGRVPLHIEIRNTFGINVCCSCSKTEMKFVTKTNCMQGYLLSEDDLKQFKYLSRPNPHKGTWNDMQLYMEDQIKEFAFEKYGNQEAIERIKDERCAKNKNRKLQKVRKRVKDLKKKTFVQSTKKKHVHKFVGNGKTSVCECGVEIEEEEL